MRMKEYENDLLQKSRSLVATDHKPVAILISRLLSQETQERSAAEKLYEFSIQRFSSSISVKLCEVFLCSEYDPPVRSQSIPILHHLLQLLDEEHFLLSVDTVNELKELLISCLRLQETPEAIFKILSKVVSLVAFNVFALPGDEWNDLQDYIVNTIDSDIRRVFILFNDLPPLLNRDNEFLIAITAKLFPAIVYSLNSDHPDFDYGNWMLAFKAGLSFAVQMVESLRSDLSYNLLYAIIRSAVQMVNEGLEGILRIILQDLEEVLQERSEKYYRRQLGFVSTMMTMIGHIQGIEKETKTAALTIYQTIVRTIKLRNSIGITY